MKAIFTLSLLLLSEPALATTTLDVEEKLNLLSVLICLLLVFFMQAGFTFLETGSMSAKNSIKVAIKLVLRRMPGLAAAVFC